MKDVNTKFKLKELVKQIIREITSTGDVSGYSTPYAFRKRGKNAATSYIEKMGYTVVGDIESNNDGESLVNESVQYDASKDVNDLKRNISSSETQLTAKFSAALKEKFLGKDVEVQASKGYGQFKTKYRLKVLEIKIEDWYGKSNYQLILTGEDRKQYFIDTSVPVIIIDGQTTAKPAVATVPPTSAGGGQPKKSPPATVPKPPAAPVTDLDKEISK